MSHTDTRESYLAFAAFGAAAFGFGFATTSGSGATVVGDAGLSPPMPVAFCSALLSALISLSCAAASRVRRSRSESSSAPSRSFSDCSSAISFSLSSSFWPARSLSLATHSFVSVRLRSIFMPLTRSGPMPVGWRSYICQHV